MVSAFDDVLPATTTPRASAFDDVLAPATAATSMSAFDDVLGAPKPAPTVGVDVGAEPLPVLPSEKAGQDIGIGESLALRAQAQTGAPDTALSGAARGLSLGIAPVLEQVQEGALQQLAKGKAKGFFSETPYTDLNDFELKKTSVLAGIDVPFMQSALKDWDSTTGKAITDPVERKAQRVAHVQGLATEILKDRIGNKIAAGKELSERDRTLWAKIGGGAVENIGYTGAFMAGAPMAIGTSVTRRMGELTNDAQGVNAEGKLVTTAQADGTVKAATKAAVGGYAEYAVEKMGGELLGAVGGKLFSAIPGGKRMLGAIARTPVVGEALQSFAKLGKLTGIQGMPGEVFEEVVQDVVDIGTGLGLRGSEKTNTTTLSRTRQSLSDFDTQEVILGMLLQQGAQGGVAVTKAANSYVEQGNRVDGLLTAFGVAPDTVKGMTREAKMQTYATIRDNITPDKATAMLAKLGPKAEAAYREVEERTSFGLARGETDVNKVRDAKAKYVADVAGRLSGKLDTQVFDTEDQMLAAYPEIATAPGYEKGKMGGMWHDGKVNIVLDQMKTPADIVKNVMHESGVHAALARNEVLTEADKRAMLANLGGDAYERAASMLEPLGYEGELSAEETLAYMVENSGANPSAFQRGVATVKARLRKRFPNLAFTNSDIEVLFRDARESVSGEGGAFVRVTAPEAPVAPSPAAPVSAQAEAAPSAVAPAPDATTQATTPVADSALPVDATEAPLPPAGEPQAPAPQVRENAPTDTVAPESTTPVGDVTKPVGEATAAQPEVLPPVAKAKPAAKPIYDMTLDELTAARDKAVADGKSADVRVFGIDGAKAYNAAQRIVNSSTTDYNSPRYKAAEATVASMEDGLSESQRRDLFGMDMDYSPEDLKAYVNALESVDAETPAEMGDALKTSITDVDVKTPPAEMSARGKLAYAKLRRAFELARERGWDTKEVSDAAINAAGKRFSDPADALYMLRDLMTSVQPAAPSNAIGQPTAAIENVPKTSITTAPAIQSTGDAVQPPAATAPAEATAPAAAPQQPAKGPVAEVASEVPVTPAPKALAAKPVVAPPAPKRKALAAKPKPAVPAHQQTQAEYVVAGGTAQAHKSEVGRAIRAGEAVSADVMAAYPDVAAKVAASAEKAAGKADVAEERAGANVIELDSKYRLAKPIKGKDGNSIIGYRWMTKLEDGMYGDRRVSDWELAQTSVPTGRSIVHLYWVADKDGRETLMGVGAAKSALGMSEPRLYSIAKAEQANQKAQQEQWDRESASLVKSSAKTPAEADAQWRKVNTPSSISMASRQEQQAVFDAMFAKSSLIEKDGAYRRTGDTDMIQNLTERGWKVVDAQAASVEAPVAPKRKALAARPATPTPAVSAKPVAAAPDATVAKPKALAAKVVAVDKADGGVAVSVPSADKPSITPKAQKAYLLAEIDKAIEGAPSMPELDVKRAEVDKLWKKGSDTSAKAAQQELEAMIADAGLTKVTIDVPGDGQFSVWNEKSTLEIFKRNTERRLPTKVTKTDPESQARHLGTVAPNWQPSVLVGYKPDIRAGESKKAYAERMKEWEKTHPASVTSATSPTRFRRVTPEQDAAYAAAVARGDEAEAQRMVDDAARAAGYTVGPVWHGTNQEFKAFETGREGAGSADGFWFAEDRDMALMYGRPKAYYVKDAEQFGDTYAVYDANNIKSSDPITRDDAGNVVPLSARFNEASNDIRFRRVDGAQTETPEFKAWFGASKVVDVDGKPLVVYHAGTFDETENGVPQINGDGFHFGTKNASQERQYGKQIDDWMRELKIDEQDGRWFWASGVDDSYDLRGEEGFDGEVDARRDAEQFAMDMDLSDTEEMPVTQAYLSLKNPMRSADMKSDWKETVARAKARGHDGIVYRNEFEDKGNDSYIAFRPAQIKSATGNTGAFDAANPDIRFRRTDTPSDAYQRDIRDAGLSDRYVQVPKAQDADVRVKQVIQNAVYADNLTREQRDEVFGRAQTELDANRNDMILEAAGGSYDKDTSIDAARMVVANEAAWLTALRSGNAVDADVAVEVNDRANRKFTRIGRALAMLRDRFSTPDARRAELAKLMFAPNDVMQAKMGAAKNVKERKALRQELVRRGRNTVRQLSKMTVRVNGVDVPFDVDAFTNEQLMDDAFMRAAVKKIGTERAGIGAKVYEWWVNSILSGPTTLLFVNPVGNMANIGLEMGPQRQLEIFLNNFVKSDDAPTRHSTSAFFKYAAKAKQQALANFAENWRTENPPLGAYANKFDMGGQAIGERPFGVNVGFNFGKAVRAPRNMLSATDQLFRTMLQAGHVADLATRRFDALVADPASGVTSDMYEAFLAEANNTDSEIYQQAEKIVDRQLFQSDPGTVGNALLAARNQPVFGWLWKYMLPFITTPANVIKTAARKTPLGTVPFLAKAATGKFSGTSEARAEGVRLGAEQLAAWAMMVGIYSLLKGDDDDPLARPRLTGNPLSGGKFRPGLRESEKRDYPAMSVRIGDNWYSYRRVEPIATMLATVVDFVNVYEMAQDKRSAEIPEKVMNTFISVFSDRTYLKTVGDLLDAARDGDPQAFNKIIGGTLAGFNPNLVKSALRATDPYVRDMRNREDGAKGLLTSVERIAQMAFPSPLVMEQPIARYDIAGRPVTKAGGFTERFVSPFGRQDATRLTKVDAMLRKYQNAHPDENVMPAPPQVPEIKAFGSKTPVAVIDAEYADFQRIAGEWTNARLSSMSFNYAAPTEQDVERVKRIYAAGRDVARNRIRGTVLKRVAAEKRKA